jgi:hypothetical protein
LKVNLKLFRLLEKDQVKQPHHHSSDHLNPKDPEKKDHLCQVIKLNLQFLILQVNQLHLHPVASPVVNNRLKGQPQNGPLVEFQVIVYF